MSSKNVKSLKCSNCGANLDVNENEKLVECNFCKAKYSVEELLNNDSDEVKIQKIKSKTTENIEMEKIKNTNEKEKRNEEKESLEKFKKSKLNIFIIIFIVISIFAMLFEFSKGFSLSGVIALMQAGLFISAWLMGMQIIKEPRKNIHVLLAVLGFVLIIPFFNFTTDKEYKSIDWDDVVIEDVLPEPPENKGEFILNDEDSLSLIIANVSKKEYKGYIDDCKKKGFTVDSKKDQDSYESYNKDGYKLELSFDEDDKEMRIRLEVPIKMTENAWPSVPLAAVVPRPKSNLGNLSWTNETDFYYYAGNTSSEDFKNYVSEAKAKGFTVNYSEGDDYFFGKNSVGYGIDVRLKGFNIMEIRVDAPSKETTTTVSASTTTVAATTAATTTKKAETSGLRADFKQAMDDYETFMNKYVSFMKKYNNSDGLDMKMLKEYSSMMTDYAKFLESFEKWESEDLNTKELNYYIEVQTRVNKKLEEIQ